MPEPANIFISFAFDDEVYFTELRSHLGALEHDHRIRIWGHHKVQTGEDWRSEVDRQIDSADVILLLLSASLLGSEAYHDDELEKALTLARTGKARVIPIRLRPYDWGAIRVSELQTLPRNGKAVTQWPDRDEAWAHIAGELRLIVAPDVNNPGSQGTDAVESHSGEAEHSDVLNNARQRSSKLAPILKSEDLEQITPSGTATETAFPLVQGAETHEKIDALRAVPLKGNGGNPTLRTSAAALSQPVLPVPLDPFPNSGLSRRVLLGAAGALALLATGVFLERYVRRIPRGPRPAIVAYFAWSPQIRAEVLPRETPVVVSHNTTAEQIEMIRGNHWSPWTAIDAGGLERPEDEIRKDMKVAFTLNPDGIMFVSADKYLDEAEELASGACDSPKHRVFAGRYDELRKLVKASRPHPNVKIGFFTGAIRACAIKAAERDEMVVVFQNDKEAWKWTSPGSDGRRHVETMLSDAKARGVYTWAILTNAVPTQVTDFVQSATSLGVDYLWVTHNEPRNVGTTPPRCNLQGALWDAMTLDPRPSPCLEP